MYALREYYTECTHAQKIQETRMIILKNYTTSVNRVHEDYRQIFYLIYLLNILWENLVRIWYQLYIRRHILIVWSVIIKLDELYSQYHTCLRSILYGYSESG